MIKACIFDLGGTIVDKYSLTPFLTLKKIFANKKIHVNNNLIFKDMGIDKRDHIFKIISHKNISKQWSTINGEYPDEFQYWDQTRPVLLSEEPIPLLPFNTNER